MTAGLEFALESYSGIVHDIRPLLIEHHRELALFQNEIPLDPDFDKYEALSEAGAIRFYSARLNGTLIGYAIYAVIERHLHYRHRWAVNDVCWIAPEHRNFGVGSLLFDFVERDLASAGPIVMMTETKLAHVELAGLLTARGHETIGLVLAKRLG